MAEPKPEATPPTPKPPAGDETSAGVVRRGPKTKREIGLEKKVSELEDERAQSLLESKELRAIVDVARQTPSARIPGKSLWDELNSFMGYGA